MVDAEPEAAEPEAAEPPEPEPPRVPHPASRAHASAVSHVTDAEPEPPVEQPPPVAHPASAARASAADHSPGARRRTYGRHPGSGRQRASVPQADDSWDPHETPSPDGAPQDSWGSPEEEHWDPRTTPDQYAAAPPHDWGAAPGHQEPWDPYGAAHAASARHESWDPRDAAPHAAHAPQEAWHQQEAWESQETFVPHEAWTTYPATGSPEAASTSTASAPPQAPWVDPHPHPTGVSRQSSAWPWSEPAFGQAPAPATTAPRKTPKVRRKPANITAGSTRSKAVRAAKITAGTLTGAVVAIVTGVWVGFAVAPSEQLPTIQVGQCVRQDGAQARRVDCTEPDAYTVTARVFPAGSCPDPAQPYAMQEQTQLCLAPAARKPAGPKPAAPPTRRYGP
ncbi:hypothetical protein [Dactylosporangium sp. NPDC006015]|uniref:LppU/SCO3897 family protein n=1 Tax=Dactylosporangium sp. NPDC006015 TaxID=3154576 RepID=UPI0033BD5B5D